MSHLPDASAFPGIFGNCPVVTMALTKSEPCYGHAIGTVHGVRPGEAVRHFLNFEVFSTIRGLRRPDPYNHDGKFTRCDTLD